MIQLTFLNTYAPILVMLVSFILSFSALKALKIPGNNATLAILSALLAFIFVSSTTAVNYVFSLIPLLTIVMIISFFVLISLVLVAKDISTFKKPLAIIGFILAILISLCLAFNQFHTLNSLLPGASNSGLNSSLVTLKNFIYSADFKESLLLLCSVFIVGFFIIEKKKA